MLLEKVQHKIRKPWRKTLIDKLLGKKINIQFLEQKLRQIWSLQVKELTPNFDPSSAVTETITTWMRLPNMVMDYYDKDILKHEGVHMICFGCGRYEHTQEHCDDNIPKMQPFVHGEWIER
ncbi:hypothetical protein L6164_023797 [Bauhinia variegata]|uniref:Uncharacterized protein n=1 Tax=Bauhinia variegata TaxID=167791 RepID=A0ACB9MKR8_BAUVA|nr:hypothetical protein L6164_023797 [Bauhinia variegata]